MLKKYKLSSLADKQNAKAEEPKKLGKSVKKSTKVEKPKKSKKIKKSKRKK